MPPKRRNFFNQDVRPEDDLARQNDLAAVLTTRQTYPQDIAIERIQPNPFQARRKFTDLESLADAIRQQGFVSRLRLRPDPQRPGFFQLVFGERRLRAAEIAGLSVVPCDVANHSDEEMIEIGLAENIQRRDLDPLEEARAFQTFIDERGYSIRRLAERIGKDKSYIEDRLILMRVPEDVQRMIEQRPDALRAAREIAKIPTPDERQKVIANILAGRITSQEIRQLARETAPAAALADQPPAPQLVAKIHTSVERDLQTVRSILRRWNAIQSESEEQRAAVAAQTEVLLREVQQLADTLKR